MARMNASDRRSAARVVPGWLLDEVASAGRENLDADHVARYDTKEDAGAVTEVALLQSLGLTSSSVVVEFGVGTGQFTLAVAPLCERVVAVDVSLPMLARLQHKIDDANLTNIEVVEAGFVSYEHGGAPADVVYSRYAMHHLPDFWKAIALARMHRWVRPGGLVRLWDVVYNFEPHDADARIEAWCSTARDTDAFEPLDDGWGRWELEEHVRDEHSTFTWILEPMFERTGFTIEASEYTEDAMFAKYVLRRR
jgi:ubiquinone/menaquinone biosynthesis C-methylase UbiE